jgi:hypothetical protein
VNPIIYLNERRISTLGFTVRREAPAQYSRRKMKLTFGAGASRTPEKTLVRLFFVRS